VLVDVHCLLQSTQVAHQGYCHFDEDEGCWEKQEDGEFKASETLAQKTIYKRNYHSRNI
jgi:hypothetical protein